MMANSSQPTIDDGRIAEYDHGIHLRTDNRRIQRISVGRLRPDIHHLLRSYDPAFRAG